MRRRSRSDRQFAAGRSGGSTTPRSGSRAQANRSSWRRFPSPPRPLPRTCMCRRFAAPRTRAYAHAVLILGLVINPRRVFSLSSFLSFASFLSFLRFLFWPCLAPFFGLCITRLRHPPLTKSGYKKSASFPTRLRLGFGGGVFFNGFLLVLFFRKPRPTLAGQGRVKSEKNAVGFGIICGITRG